MTKSKNRMMSLALVCLIGFQPVAFGASSTYGEIIAAWFANLKETVSEWMKSMTPEDRKTAMYVVAGGTAAVTGLAVRDWYLKRRAEVIAKVDSLSEQLKLQYGWEKKSAIGLGGLYGEFPVPIIWSFRNLVTILRSEVPISLPVLRELIKREELYIQPALLLNEVTIYEGFDANLAQKLNRETAALKVYCDKYFSSSYYNKVRPWDIPLLEKWKNNSTYLKQPLNYILMHAIKENG